VPRHYRVYMEEAPDSALDAACAALAEKYTGEEAGAERRTARERYVAGNEPDPGSQ